MKLSTHFAWIALIAIFLAACTDSGPAATGSEIGTSVGGQSSVPFGTSQGAQSSFSMGGGSSSSGGTSGQMGCLMEMAAMNISACAVGMSAQDCELDPEDEGQGMTLTYGACPTGWTTTCVLDNIDGTITFLDYSPNGEYCEMFSDLEV